MVLQLWANKWLCCQDQESVIKGMFWRSTKKEIIEWLERKEQKFARKENRNPWMSDEQWMQRYVYTKLHEIFFSEFLIILTKWLERLVEWK
jgi:hypothetical protein